MSHNRPRDVDPTAPSPLIELLWPLWRPERILFVDEDLLVVDKPEGVPSMAPRPEELADDVASRLRRYLAVREGKPTEACYLGVHHRLDRETSGLLLFSRSKEANPALAAQFERHLVERRYTAAVRLAPGAAPLPSSIDLPLRRARDHRHMEPAPGGGRGARTARTDLLEVRQEGERALVRLAPRTGRTHQIRVHLAALGTPVAGDRLYGGPPAPRLLLHAHELSLRHPRHGEPVRLRATLPAIFARWLHDEASEPPSDPDEVFACLLGGLERRWGLARSIEGPRPTTAFRLLHGEGEGLPGIALDRYGEYALLQVDSDLPASFVQQLAERIASLGFRGLYLQIRPRGVGSPSAERLAHLAPSAPRIGAAAPRPMIVLEEGLPFEVRLGEGFATGLYTDQREARRWLRARCEGASVLNLFGYTGAFSVAAAAGGARRTVTVDTSRPALRWAERNIALGGYGGEHRFVRGDALETLDVMRLARERFDFVVLDPPTYGSSRRSRWRSLRDWPKLVAAACRVLASGGWIYASSNDRRLSHRTMRRALERGAEAAGRSLDALRERPPPIDYPHPATLEPHLRAWLCRLR